MNTGDLAQAELYEAERRVLKIQTKLHQWATNDPDRRFADLFNLVADPAVLRVAWDRVRSNRGARSAGVDGVRPRDLRLWEQEFLAGLRAQLKAGRSPGAASSVGKVHQGGLNQRIQELAVETFRVGVRRPEQAPLEHSAVWYLLGPDARVVRTFPYSTSAVKLAVEVLALQKQS